MTPNGIARVIMIGEHSPCYTIKTGEGEAAIFPRNLQPIPLTAEVLEKNGFERCVSSIVRTPSAVIPVCDSNQFAISGHPNLRIIDSRLGDYSLRTPVVCDTNYYEIHKIKYVHELQHALRLCGIELEIKL